MILFWGHGECPGRGHMWKSSKRWSDFQFASSQRCRGECGAADLQAINAAAFFKINELQTGAIFSYEAKCFLKCQEKTPPFPSLLLSLSFDFSGGIPNSAYCACLSNTMQSFSLPFYLFDIEVAKIPRCCLPHRLQLLSKAHLVS